MFFISSGNLLLFGCFMIKTESHGKNNKKASKNSSFKQISRFIDFTFNWEFIISFSFLILHRLCESLRLSTQKNSQNLDQNADLCLNEIKISIKILINQAYYGILRLFILCQKTCFLKFTVTVRKYRNVCLFFLTFQVIAQDSFDYINAEYFKQSIQNFDLIYFGEWNVIFGNTGLSYLKENEKSVTRRFYNDYFTSKPVTRRVIMESLGFIIIQILKVKALQNRKWFIKFFNKRNRLDNIWLIYRSIEQRRNLEEKGIEIVLLNLS